MIERQKLRECEHYLGDDAQRSRKFSVFDVNELCALHIIITARNKVPGKILAKYETVREGFVSL